MEISKIKRAAEIAKARTNDKRWHSAIDKAVAGVESGWWIITELAHGVAVTTECGNTYFANGSCQCKAFANGQACKHRALARLVEIASELKEETAPAVSSREDIIAEIETAFAAKFPSYRLADAVCRQFGPYSLSNLGIANLNQFLAAIA